jgi:hypothetical protein
MIVFYFVRLGIPVAIVPRLNSNEGSIVECRRRFRAGQTFLYIAAVVRRARALSTSMVHETCF